MSTDIIAYLLLFFIVSSFYLALISIVSYLFALNFQINLFAWSKTLYCHFNKLFAIKTLCLLWYKNMSSQFVLAKKISNFEFYFANKLLSRIKISILLQSFSVFNLSNMICLLSSIVDRVFSIGEIGDWLAMLLSLIYINLSNIASGKPLYLYSNCLWGIICKLYCSIIFKFSLLLIICTILLQKWIAFRWLWS